MICNVEYVHLTSRIDKAVQRRGYACLGVFGGCLIGGCLGVFLMTFGRV